ncbi:MAG: tetratricopeptide repeat protein [Candidatus Peribacter sp.]|jgi:protein O-mannosyl-transferase|nr:tetratricopeptide repeat protein [Candidatus Peribacter sp.]MBT4393468.1 tetratricopeptide repeat protein [Candidatus Peribacter sp.]MBT4600827.1 tetratricopeptide repeat protein [Candidatus Peribacter sp.]MBT5149474.1 tetratricopeptide repeat protein [Candidatus Peribacter sp.]MBT5637327.1 tetratricopeptide repeat protein [Candidatus Peribacter sp.]
MRNFSSKELVGFIIGLFVAVGFLVYGYGVFTNDFVSFDDGLLIYDNISVIRAGSLWSVQWAFANYDPELYIPLTFLSLQLDAIIGGMNPFIFHFTNLLLHIANALLITWIIRLLFKRLDIAVLLGLLFLVHPLNVEAVSWAASRKDVLSSFFFFAAIVGYLHFLETQSVKLHFVSIGLFILGLLAKVSIIPLPLVLVCIDWYKSGTLRIADLWQKKGYIAAAIPFGLLALLGKDVVLERSSPVFIGLLIPKSILFYLEKAVLPLRLSVFYPIDTSTITLAHAAVLVPMLLLAAVVGALWYFRTKRHTWSVGAIIMMLLFIPSFLQYYRGNDLYLASDRYMYLAFLGLIIIIASEIAKIISLYKLKITYGVLGIVIISFSILTVKRSLVWKDTLTLFTDVLQYEESFLAYEKVGSELLVLGKRAEAIEALKKSIDLAPSSAAFVRLGIAAEETKNWTDAKLFYLKALESSPEHAQAHTNLGRIYWDESNRTLAIDHMERAVENHPWNMMALGNLASMYTLTGQKEKALEIIDAILLLEPNNERVGPLLKKLGVQR